MSNSHVVLGEPLLQEQAHRNWLYRNRAPKITLLLVSFVCAALLSPEVCSYIREQLVTPRLPSNQPTAISLSAVDFKKSWVLVDTNGGRVPSSQLQGLVVALYFSAHWCPPCGAFTPTLKAFYEAVKQANGKLEVVFVSCDKSDSEARHYFQNAHGNWCMLDRKQAGPVSSAFHIQRIPTLLVIDAAGKVQVADGVAQVQHAVSKGPAEIGATFAKWEKLCLDWRQTAGRTVGGATLTREAMRAAVLARFSSGCPSSTSSAETSTAAPSSFSEKKPSSTLEAQAPISMSTPQPLEPKVAPPPATSSTRAQEQPNMTDSAIVAQLTSMGFGKEASMKVLDAARGNLETAVKLLRGSEFQAEPHTTAQSPASLQAETREQSSTVMDQESLTRLVSLGFGEDVSRNALEAAGGDVEIAIDLLASMYGHEG